MTEVLVVAAVVPRALAFADAAAQFRERGATVRLATYSLEPGMDLGLPAEDLRYLRGPDIDAFEPAFWRANFLTDNLARQVWMHAERDAWTLERAARADFIVALDPHAIFAVWNLAQLNPQAEARLGLAPALEILAGTRPAHVASGDEVPAAAPLLVAGSSRSWLRRLRSALGGAVRARSRSAPAVPDEAVRASEVRADRYGAAVAADLVNGRTPRDLVTAYAAELDLAGRLFADGRVKAAAASYLQAIRLAFHRGVHIDSLHSPLAEDPAGFTAPLQDNAVHRVLARNQGRVQQPRRAGAARTRVLLASLGNDHFLREVISSLADHEDIEVRVAEAQDFGRFAGTMRNPIALIRAVVTRPGKTAARAERALRPLLDWADVVFVDWCSPVAYAITSLVDPGGTRIIVRLHSFEAFTVWPQLIDYSRVDTMVFVSDHLRDLTVASSPRLARSGTNTVVMSNAMDLRRCVRPKAPEARFGLGLIGVSAIAKDPRWAIEVLRRVRAHDPRYHLVLIGADLGGAATHAGRRYTEAYFADLAELEPVGAVRRVGHTDDIPGALADVGVILSTSVREGQPVGVLEGAASGAVPVVRDWPFFATLDHGARTLFPEEWVVTSPEEAAERILEVTADEDTWRANGAKASAEAIARFDISMTRADFHKLLTT